MIKATNNELKELKKLISEQGLDYSFINYGGFTSKVNPASYHPDHRKERESLKEFFKITVGSIIYQVFKNEYDVLITKKQNEDFKKFIEEQNKKPKNIKRFNQLFNAFTFEITIYSDVFMDCTFNKDWYSCNEMKEKLPLNASKEREEELKNEAIKQAKETIKNIESKGRKVDGFEVRKKLLDVHYLNEEWNEFRLLVEEIGKKKNIKPIIPHQSSRRLKEDVDKKRIKDFKEYTLKSTGRKLLLDVFEYGCAFIEIESIVK